MALINHKMEEFVIPAIDIIDGKCVRLSQGDYNRKTIYDVDPLNMAMKLQDAGFKRLHLVDLDGAKKGSVVNMDVLRKIAGNTSFIIDFGGGIKSDADIKKVFENGAHIATIGSVAVTNPAMLQKWLAEYGGSKILVGADVRNEVIAINGWLEQTELSIFDLVEQLIPHGLTQYFCTDISKDGMMSGPSVELYKNLIARFPELHLIGSGGVSSLSDALQLQSIGCAGAIVGKALYQNGTENSQLKMWTTYAG